MNTQEVMNKAEREICGLKITDNEYSPYFQKDDILMVEEISAEVDPTELEINKTYILLSRRGKVIFGRLHYANSDHFSLSLVNSESHKKEIHYTSPAAPKIIGQVIRCYRPC